MSLIIFCEFEMINQEQIRILKFMLGLASSRNYQSMPLKAALSLAQTTDTNMQFKLYFDSNLEPVGLITWAWVSQDCLDRVCETGDLSLHPSEWNEGRILWFRDVAVNARSAFEIAHDLSGGLFSEFSEFFVTMQSRKSGRSIPVKFSSTDRTQLADWIRNKV